jgi:hypothetical protein
MITEKEQKIETCEVSLIPYNEEKQPADFDYDGKIFDLEDKIDLLSSKGDKFDYLLAVASGLLCGILDLVWVGEFSLERGRAIADEQVNSFVNKTAKMLGFKGDDLSSAVKFLESRFPIPSDGNTPDFGGGLQHHLRDFAHHPTIVGLAFSLLTQFTEKSYGTNTAGVFIIVDVPLKSKAFIGDDVPSKILYGTVTWFFHLVSDMAGSGSTAGLSGGTGIPGPVLALAKELAAIPPFNNLKVNDNSLSAFLSKLFNGTFFAKRDTSGKIIKDTVLKFDLRGELGAGIELARQSLPVIANEIIVRGFYFIRRLASEIKDKNVHKFNELNEISWDNIKPYGNPTITRMLTISTSVFTTVDITEAIVSQKYLLGINYPGVGRFAVAVGEDVSYALKIRDIRLVKQVYETIKLNAYMREDNNIYERFGSHMNLENFGLTIEQTEILYNLEYQKVLNDISVTIQPINKDGINKRKQEWLNEWKNTMSAGFSSFIQDENAVLHWYSKEELISRIEANEPEKTWYRLALLEAMLFEPYYTLTIEKDKNGKDIPSKKYVVLQKIPTAGYSKSKGDEFLENLFTGDYYENGYIKRLRKCYDKVIFDLKEVLKGIMVGGVITAVTAIAIIATAGALAPSIAVALVGSQFAGLSGAALTSACLAYLGGGAIAVGGFGMAGGTAVIVGGGAALGLTAGAGIGGAVGKASILQKQSTILQSAKLLVSVREIFLNDEHDTDYSDSIYEQYVKNTMDIEKGIVELKYKAETASEKEKKELKNKIKNAEKAA